MVCIKNEPKKRILILEGADNLGKSYQAKVLTELNKATLLNQPNESNTLGYMRKDLKYNKDIDITVRQMFHGFQNSVDIFEFPRSNMIIMDRCYLSNLVYSSVMGVPPDVMDMMCKMNKTIWQKYLSEYEIELVVFTAIEPFKAANEEDVYESSNMWQALDAQYKIFLSKRKGENSIFPPNVKCRILDISIMSKEAVTDNLMFGGSSFMPPLVFENLVFENIKK